MTWLDRIAADERRRKTVHIIVIAEGEDKDIPGGSKELL